MREDISLDSASHLKVWRWGVPLVSLILMLSLLLLGVNTQVFLTLNHVASNLGDIFWSHVTVLGDVVSLLIILLMCGRRPQIVWHFILAALFAILWTQSLKSPLGVMRPPAVLDLSQFHLIGNAFIGNSFPSGHTTTIFVIVGVLCLHRFSLSLKFGLLGLAILVGVSRIACGVHWPLDVLGGAFGGWLAAVAGGWVSLRWKAGLNDNFQRVVALLFLVVAFWVIFRDTEEFVTTIPFQIILAILAIVFSVLPLLRLFGYKR
ncbi:MAG: phosphoesterase, PA-phosphatase related protein [Gallionellaceae bacterium]|nr:MAG: phosphoesterase, PA-phosphatase related protein [Gallionellaceae bacterium]